MTPKGNRKMNMYYCSDGSRVSEATIKSRLSKAYRDRYQDGHPSCEGCGGRAQGSGHIISKARLKTLHLSDKIYDPDFFLPACHSCNSLMENTSSEAFKKLLCYDKCLTIIKKYDPERYSKIDL